jgi:hypothetical protein
VSTRFGGTYTEIGTIQRKLAWPLQKDDTQNREVFHIFALNVFNNKTGYVWQKKFCTLYIFRNTSGWQMLSNIEVLLRYITDRLALFAHSVFMKPNFQGLLWDGFGGVGEDEL